ncbi:MAG: 23S rRNA (uracil(1939)-C(5))-methyltransferase RlmD, partial [Acutalibacteraceae bacterium]
AMLILVTENGEFPKSRSFVNAVIKKHPEIVSVVQNVYTGDAVLMTGEKDTVLYGGGYIEDELCERQFRVSAQSFYQVNAAQTERLYSAAVELAGLDGNSVFLDAYCGTGTVGIIAAQKAKRGIGVEINKSAVDDAGKNAALNLCENIKFYCGDAGEFLEKSGETFDVVFTDPPRAGCSKKFLNSLCKSGVEKIVYISCNPETLARDLRFMIKNGYSVEKIIPFDLFPQTSHIESLVRLSRKH